MPLSALWPVSDPLYGEVRLLMPFNEAAGSTSFRDFSLYWKTPTVSGNIISSSSQAKNYATSVYFDGVSDQINVGGYDALKRGAGPITFEAWAYGTTMPSDFGSPARFVMAQTADSNYGYRMYVALDSSTSSARLYVVVGGVTLKSASSISAGQWYHFAGVFDGTNLSIYINGVRDATAAATPASTNESTFFGIGYNPSNTDQSWHGYLQDVRVTMAARYTANFTPPGALVGMTDLFPKSVSPFAVTHPTGTPLAQPARQLRADDLRDRLPFGVGDTLGSAYWEFKGRGRITGTVKVKGTPTNAPVHRRVLLYREPEGVLVSATWSDPVTGAYEFNCIKPQFRYTVMSYDHTHDFRAVLADNLTPEVI